MMAASEQGAPRLRAPVPWLPVRLVWGGFLVAAAAELRVPVALCHAMKPASHVRGATAERGHEDTEAWVAAAVSFIERWKQLRPVGAK